MFIDKALAAQRADGSFNEHGGSDTSYQATSMLNMEVLMTYVADPAQVARLGAALGRATAWETAHVNAATGQVSVAGNTRTGLDQEIGPSGQPKDVNVGEVGLSLAYASRLTGVAGTAALAGAVNKYAVTLRSAAGTALVDDVVGIDTGAHVITGAAAATQYLFLDPADSGDEITNFHQGKDVLDLRAVFRQSTSTVVSDLIAVRQVGRSTVVTVDPDGRGGGAAHMLVTLDNVVAASLHVGTDVLLR